LRMARATCPNCGRLGNLTFRSVKGKRHAYVTDWLNGKVGMVFEPRMGFIKKT